jgi:hypothetical protein
VRGNFAQFLKSSQNNCQAENENFDNPKQSHPTTFETLKYLQQTMFLNCFLGGNVKYID